MPNTVNINFITAATGPVTSDVFDNFRYSLAILQVTGSFAEAEIVVEGRTAVPDGPWEAIGGWDTRDMGAELSALTSSGIYEFPIDGIRQLRIRIAALGGGSVTVSGAVYDSSDGSRWPEGFSGIRFGGSDLFVKGAAEQIFTDPSTGNIVGYDRVSSEAAVSMSVNFAEISGGMGNRLVGVLPDTVRISGTYMSEAFSLSTREKILGGRLAYDTVVPFCERITAESETLRVTKTPVPFYGEDFKPDGVQFTPHYRTISETALASFVTEKADRLRQLSVGIEPVQDLHGYDSPWPAGGGKNKLPNTATTSTIQGVTFTVGSDGVITANGTSTGWTGLTISTFTLPAGDYKLYSLVEPAYTYNCYLSLTVSGTSIANTSSNGTSGIAFSLVEDTELVCRLFARPNSVLANVIIKPMILLSTETAKTYAPYSNICPITGWTGANIHVSPTSDPADGRTYSITFPSEDGTVYGGTLDVTNGVLTVDRAMMDLGTLTWSYQTTWRSWYTGYRTDVKGTSVNTETPNFVAEQYPAVATYIGVGSTSDRIGITSTVYGASGSRIVVRNGSNEVKPTGKLVYELATPQTYYLTPQEIDTLLGVNNVWADTGEIETLEYLKRVTEETVAAENTFRAYVREAGDPSARGTACGVDSITREILGFTAEAGAVYEVTYYVHNISAQMLPAPSSRNPVIMTVQTRYAVYGRQGKNANQGILRGWLYFIVPRAILSGDAGLDASQTATGGTDGSWIALPDKRENLPFCDCADNLTPVAYYVWVPCGDETASVSDVVSIGGGLTLKAGETTRIPVKLVMPDDSLVQPDFTRLGYYSENEAVASVDNAGMITGEDAGETVIHAYLHRAEGEPLEALSVVTVTGSARRLTAMADHISIRTEEGE